MKVDEVLSEAVQSAEMGATACIGIILFEAGNKIIFSSRVFVQGK